MELFPDVTNMKVFPRLESNTYEFKLVINTSVKAKCISTICGFLNSKGGYLVFGVSDEKRLIEGISGDSLTIDRHLRWFDEFYHQKYIVDSNNNPLTPGELTASVIYVTDTTKIIVATIKPTKGKTYKCYDGTIYHRLSASTYNSSGSSFHDNKNNLNKKISNEQKKYINSQLEVTLLRNKNKIIEDELAQSNLMISKLQMDINEIIGLAKNSDEKLDLLTNHLCQDILERKIIAEQKIIKKSWWNCFKNYTN
jgi:predicted HTH transcriptional regulator